ncbi:DNRLRE domain-containing protein [Kitasatospora sp. NPDC096077]|uniref:DNRLRE domain-containing protein n=1 Tax=Kitasatospora sp. NPDC096077 TaxID=3155544 RepID=UPI003331872C
MKHVRRISPRAWVAGGVSVSTALAMIAGAAPAIAEPAPVSGQSASAKGPTVTEAVTVEPALVAARVQGTRVEVLDRRSETMTTWANPDGTLTTEAASGPIRILQGGTWVPVDATLVRQPDGSARAKAHPEGLTLGAPGGVRARSAQAAADAPAASAHDLITLGKGGDAISVQWKGGLPAPVLDGTRATYKDAVVGGDLVVDATRTGFEQYLVLNRPPADGAAPMTLPLRVPGVKAVQQPDGSIAFVDPKSGATKSVMPAPTMWDAGVDPRSGEHTRSARVPMTLEQHGSTVELRLTPDQAFLNDPATKYPVTIDPSTASLSVLFDTFVQGGDTTDQSTSTDLKLGWPGDYAGGVQRTARSFMTFDTKVFADALVSKATLKLYEYHAWSCAARGWEVWAADPADTRTRWTNQPALKQKIATSTETRSATCNTAGYTTTDLTGLVQTWSSAKADTGSIALKATDENDTYAWKRFYSSEVTNPGQVPVLEVTYNYRPVNGANLQAGPPYYNEGGVYKVNTTTPVLRFSTEDTNVEDQVQGTFEITDKGTGQVVATVTSDSFPNSRTASIKVPAGKLVDGHSYTFRTTTYDGTHWANGWSNPVTFTVDTSWKLTPQLQALGAATTALDASDVAAASSSTSTHAAVAQTDSEVKVPRDPNGAIEVTPKNGVPGISYTLSELGQQGVNLNGFVVYADDAKAVDTVVQPTLEGGARTLQVIKNATAPHEYRTAVTVPAGSVLRADENGGATLYSNGSPNADVIGTFDAPWATDANGKPVATSYRLDGTILYQTISFDSTSAFPIVVDPWWNPFSWNWKKIWGVTVRGLQRCGLGALKNTLGLGGGTVAVNLVLKKIAGRAALMLPGGGYAYLSIAVYGCISSL